MPCEFNSRSFRLVLDELCHWPSGKGTGLPIRSGRFDSDMALCLMNDIRVSANGKPAAFEAVVCRFNSFRPGLWDRHLACQCHS